MSNALLDCRHVHQPHDLVTRTLEPPTAKQILWELLTQEIPYDGMEPFAVTWLVASRGISLPLPNECPADFAELAMRCWSRTPSERPAFSAIVKKLRDMAEDGWCAGLQSRQLHQLLAPPPGPDAGLLFFSLPTEDMPGAMAEYMRYRGTWHQELEIVGVDDGVGACCCLACRSFVFTPPPPTPR